MLAHVSGSDFTRRDFNQMAKAFDEKVNVKEGDPLAGDATVAASQAAPAQPAPPPTDEPPFRVPPRTAIAGVLISEWAYGRGVWARL